MDKKLKTKWLKALRSGKYRQGHENLLDSQTEAMCCLGVLGDIQGCPTSKMEDKGTWTLPDGFNAGIPLKKRIRLARMNDGERDFTNDCGDIDHPHTFAEIADYIEKNL